MGSNDMTWASTNPLKIGICEFCAFVRGRRGKTSPYAYTGAGGQSPIHNNKNNNNIYIKGVAGGSVASGGIV
jgi:hypothetical protein